jgi:hypothetical protein
MDPAPTRPNSSNRSPLGDHGWIGVDMRVDPAQLPPGYAAKAINMRFVAGVPQPRKGRVMLPWLNQISGSDVLPWGTIYGVGSFKDPATLRRYRLLAADGAVYAILANNAPFSIPLPSGVTITDDVRFTQAFDRVFMHRGFDLATLELTSIDGAWTTVPDPPSGTGLQTMPNVERSVFLSDRLFTLQEDDEIGASDIGEPRYYVPFIQELAIKQGSADDLIEISKLGKSALIGLKDQSIHVVYNVRGDLSDLQQHELTDEFGCVAPDAVSRVGNDLWVLSQIGLVAIEEYAASENQSYLRIKSRVNERGEVVPVRISEPLQPLFERINWSYVHLAQSARVGTRYYLALPLDRAESFGPELAGGGALYDASDEYLITGLTAGATYRWAKGTEQTVGAYQLLNGSEQLDASQDFVAQGTSVILYGSGTVTASVRKVTKGALNAIAVYDLENAAWSGYDQADDFAITEMWTDLYLGRDRLFMADSNGWCVMYEEAIEDHLPRPYVDIHLTSLPSTNTLRINGGTVVTGAPATAANTNPNQWGTQTLVAAIQNLWVDVADVGGFYAGSGSQWSAPNTITTKLSNGVRFYATNGEVPTVVGGEDFATITYGKSVPVEATLLSRGYTLPASSRIRAHRLCVNWKTWAPELSITLVLPGVNERVALLTDWTRDRTRYTKPAHTPAYELDNNNGDHATPYREDYSVALGLGGAAAGETEELDLDAGGGLAFDLFQESRQNRGLSAQGLIDRSVQVEIVSTAGSYRLQRLMIEGGDERGADGVAT